MTLSVCSGSDRFQKSENDRTESPGSRLRECQAVVNLVQRIDELQRERELGIATELTSDKDSRFQRRYRVHFKIYVPEIINHQVHTKTVFIHMHKPVIESKKPKPKEEPPKTHHKQVHHEDWSSWSSYGYHSDNRHKSGNDHNVSKNQNNHKDDKVHEKQNYKNANTLLKYHGDSYMPVLQHNNKPDYLKDEHGDTMGYSYPSQYEVREDVKETDHNTIEPYVHTYEEGYHRGSESETGEIHSNDLTKFYEDKHEEDDQSAETYNNESREKTHAGRYFVDDTEYQRNTDKYEAEKRISPRMFISL